MRRSFDALSACIRDQLQSDPMSGSLLLFVNARGDRLKAIWWDKNGYCILYKRLEEGTFRVPSMLHTSDTSVEIEARELAKILEGIALPRSKQKSIN